MGLKETGGAAPRGGTWELYGVRQLTSASSIAFPTNTTVQTTCYLSVVLMIVTAAVATPPPHALWCMWTSWLAMASRGRALKRNGQRASFPTESARNPSVR